MTANNTWGTDDSATLVLSALGECSWPPAVISTLDDLGMINREEIAETPRASATTRPGRA